MPVEAGPSATQRSNVVIVTTGLSGSSLAAGLIARAGYWCGRETVFKHTNYDHYETHENAELVRLNEALFTAAGNDLTDYADRFDRTWPARFDHLHQRIDTRPYADFVSECETHHPWLWKDPRLAMTLRFWAGLVDLSQTRIIIVSRRLDTLWTSMLIKRQIVSRRYLERYERGILSSIRCWLASRGLDWFELGHDDLVEHPAPSLDRLNAFLDTRLSVADLQAVSHRPLGRPVRSLRDRFYARLVYTRNFRDRRR